MSHFKIRCRDCGEVLEDVYCAFCEHCKNALLVTEYNEVSFNDNLREGIWRFNWLPVHSPYFEQSGPYIYKSHGLSGRLGLENLYIAFNGYWPEKGASLVTCTFKEFEAAVVIQNAKENGVDGLVVASAGNTAKSFSHLSVISGLPVVIVVPKMCLVDIWYLDSAALTPTLAVKDGDYSDSIDVARRIAQTIGFPFEGGVKNIAKRDGLGIILLTTVSKIGRMPDHYFQAIGSGTGAIGVWEMAERFIHDGRFGAGLPKLHLAQNLPFAPMVKAWEKDSKELFPGDLNPELIGTTTTRVLSSRYPAYSVSGGIYDALKATKGRMYGVRNNEVYRAMDIFKKEEGVDIVPAAGVAVAALINSVNSEIVQSSDTILLNITGGGEKRLLEEKQTYEPEPHEISKKISKKEIESLLCHILKMK